MANLNKRLIDFAQAVSEKLLNVLNKIKELEQTIQTVRGIKGDKGDPGPQGPIGERGPAGRDGITGPSGSDGRNGYTFTPSLSSAGILSWTNDGNLPNPSSINIKGPKGDIGPRGSTGPQGKQGPIGPRGPAGYEGEISNSYNGNRRNVPVSEYAVGELYNYVYESLQAQPERVWAGNVNSGDITLSKNVLGKTVIVLMQHGQSHTLTDNNLVEVVSFNAFNIENKTDGSISFLSVIWYHAWTDVRQLKFELNTSGTSMRISETGGRYLKSIYII
ncbi:Collagen triple helix repeat (20 copies) [Pasteurella canis]|uniref:Collagen triple helix repeat (20 copies) n=1 Tax=Pasteurella canis TaxID=753 RepID=A0A379ETZ6_9PAST|nr:Collagen triple helix repeat (20 copies) [Pasteurella canis]